MYPPKTVAIVYLCVFITVMSISRFPAACMQHSSQMMCLLGILGSSMTGALVLQQLSRISL
jgi:Co/Zn/Cd efflux system component